MIKTCWADFPWIEICKYSLYPQLMCLQTNMSPSKESGIASLIAGCKCREIAAAIKKIKCEKHA